MFDPERDGDPGSRSFYARLLAVVCVTVAVCAALAPSVTGFSTGADGERSCVAIVDGWHADRKGLTAAEQATVTGGFRGSEPPPAERGLFERAFEYQTWRDGPGACIPESRHRLIMSAVALGSLGALVAGIKVERRTRRSPRREPAVAGA